MNTRDRMLSGLSVVDERNAVAGGSIAALTGGAGQPVVLLHGAGEFAALWWWHRTYPGTVRPIRPTTRSVGWPS
jgi:hypothetical protein